MPLFGKKQAEENQRRLEYKLYLARENPDATFDLSECELTEIPSGVFSLCRVMQKEALVLHTNCLRKFEGGGKLQDLHALRVLDLHSNCIAQLPEEIGSLKSLQVLNLESNKLVQLPASIGVLKSLQTLNLKNNRLKALPGELCQLDQLQHLLMDGSNLLTRLPDRLALIRTLHTVTVPLESIKYPPRDVCERGTQSILKFLCERQGIDYQPATDANHSIDQSKQGNQTPASDWMANVKPAGMCAYERMKEEKRQRALTLERQMDEEARARAELASKANLVRGAALDWVVQEEARAVFDLEQLQLDRENKRRQMVTNVLAAEQSAGRLVEDLLAMNEAARHREEVMEKMERERMEAERWFLVRREESEGLRRAEILAAMQRILTESTNFDQVLSRQQATREWTRQQAQASLRETNESLQSALDNKRMEQTDLFCQLGIEEEIQKEAFKCLQLQRDARTQRIVGELGVIETELRLLSQVEQQRRQDRQENEMRALADRRASLLALHKQLMEERSRREAELRQTMIEMESRKEQDQIDYWLIQYQRLLDRKPEALMNPEQQLDSAVFRIMMEAGAQDFLPHCQRHRITIDTLLNISGDDLQQIGIYALGTRQAILAAVDNYRKLRKKEADLDESTRPSAPPLPSGQGKKLVDEKEEEEKQSRLPSAPPAAGQKKARDVIARVESECCICCERECTALFLNCGHICCCDPCADKLVACPLCRADIDQVIRLLSFRAAAANVPT